MCISSFNLTTHFFFNIKKVHVNGLSELTELTGLATDSQNSDIGCVTRKPVLKLNSRLWLQCCFDHRARDKIFLILFLPKSRKIAVENKANKQIKKKKRTVLLLLLFWCWFGLARMKKSLFPNPSFQLSMPCPPSSYWLGRKVLFFSWTWYWDIQISYCIIRLPNSTECSAEPATARPHFIPLTYCNIAIFWNWANIFSQEFWASLKPKVYWLHRVQLKCKCWHLIYGVVGKCLVLSFEKWMSRNLNWALI